MNASEGDVVSEPMPRGMNALGALYSCYAPAYISYVILHAKQSALKKVTIRSPLLILVTLLTGSK